MTVIARNAFSRKKIAQGGKNALKLLFALIYLIPLYIAVVNSFKTYWDVLKSPLSPPLQPTMENFVEAFHSSHILSLYGTSILITASSVALLIPYGALIGFNAPFVRALIMFALVCFAPTVGHPSDSVTRLSAPPSGSSFRILRRREATRPSRHLKSRSLPE